MQFQGKNAQGLKPLSFRTYTARLKSCPDTEQAWGSHLTNCVAVTVAKAASPWPEPGACCSFSVRLLAGVVHRNAAWRLLVLLLFVRLACRHGLVAPLIEHGHVCLVSGFVTAIKVGLAAVKQAEVRHRVIVSRTQVDSLLQLLDTLVHDRPVLFG